MEYWGREMSRKVRGGIIPFAEMINTGMLLVEALFLEYCSDVGYIWVFMKIKNSIVGRYTTSCDCARKVTLDFD